MKKSIITSMLLFFLLLISATPNLLHAQIVQNPANGHWYELIILSGELTWEQARDYAAARSYNGLPGHLATVTSSDENGFIEEAVISNAGSNIKFWVGGYQLSNQTQTDVGWRWITGETWSFTDWGLIQSDEPNDWPTPGENNEQNYLTINQEIEDTFWGDEGSAVTFGHLVVEYEPAAQEMLIGTTGTGGTISSLVEIDPATGNLIRTIGSVGYAVNGLVYDHTTGKLFASTSVNDPSYNGLIEINLTTGAGTPVGVNGWGLDGIAAVTNITVDSAGQMYGWWDPDEDDLVLIDKTTGIATVVGESDANTGSNGLDFDNSGALFMVNYDGSYYTVDTTTGLATYINTIGSMAHHGKFRPSTNIWYGINTTTSGPRNLVLADLLTGDVISTIPTVDNLHTLEFIQVLMYGVSGGSGGGYSNPGSFMTINQLSGEVTILGTPYGGAGLSGVATDSSGRVFAVTGIDNPDGTSHLIKINPITGEMIADIGPMYDASGNGCAIGDLSFQPGTNILFGLAANQSDVGTRCGIGGQTGGYLLTINTANAQYTVIGRDPSFENDNGGIAFAPDGTLYFTPAWDIRGFLHTLDPATAQILTSVALPSSEGYMGLAVRPSDGKIFGSHRYYSDDTGIYTIDPTTGAETLFVDPGDIMVHDLTFPGGGLICEMPFTDVPSGFWAEDYIRALYCEGIANGYADNTFRPSQNASRAQTAAFIIRAQFGENFSYTPTAHFTDVPDSHWAFKYVQKMYDEGISTGYPDGTFRPSESVSRSQTAALIIKAKFPGGFPFTPTPFFTDVPDSHWAFQYVQKMYDEGITTGYTDGTYRPAEYVSRSQISAFVARAFLGMD